MKGKRYTTEDRIRILREADGGKNIVELCREKNISEVTFHRWKKQFGQMDLNEAKRLKELERENTELKKMLAEALLAKREGGSECPFPQPSPHISLLLKPPIHPSTFAEPDVYNSEAPYQRGNWPSRQTAPEDGYEAGASPETLLPRPPSPIPPEHYR